MWMLTPNTTISVIQDHDRPAMLQVRSRVRQDLVDLLPGHHIIETPERDYGFRVIVPRKVLAQRVYHFIMKELDYTNVKGATLNDTRHDAYFGCWRSLLALKGLNPRPRRKPARRRNQSRQAELPAFLFEDVPYSEDPGDRWPFDDNGNPREV